MLYYICACIIRALSVASISDITPTISTIHTRQVNEGHQATSSIDRVKQ